MKKSKKILSLFLALMMFMTAFGVSAGAETGKAEWDTYWTDGNKEIEAAVTMMPGSDESQRHIAWYSDTAEGYVELTSAEGTETITATAKKTAQGDYRLGAVLENLTEGTYSYKCFSGDYISESYDFEVKKADSFTALYVSDIHVAVGDNNENNVRDTAYKFNRTLESATEKALATGGLDLILSGGDEVSNGYRKELVGLSSTDFTKSLPFANIVGNHERKSVDYKYYTFHPNEGDLDFKSYIGTDYWFRQGNTLFLMLDSCNASMQDHYLFIKQAVKQNEDAKWTVAIMHHDMHGGREPHLNTENTLLRLLWCPIFDEFGIDLCLSGHSHYYSISNPIFARKSTESIADKDKVTDPLGTVYLSSGSINNIASLVDDEGNVPPLGENIGKSYLTREMIYNLLEVTDTTLTVRSYTVESGEEFESFTIEKTSKEGGHVYATDLWFLQPLLFFVSRIVNIINNIDMYRDYLEEGHKVTLWEGLIGS